MGIVGWGDGNTAILRDPIPAGSVALSDLDFDPATQLELDPVISALNGKIALSTVTTAGDLIVGTGSAAVSRLALGTALQVLRVNAGGTAAEWGAVSLTGLQGALTSTVMMSVGVTGDTQPRREIRANGEMYAGDGSVAPVVAMASRSGTTLLGRSAAAADTSNTATAIGINALLGNTSGANNVAVGGDAARTNTTGGNLVAIGINACRGNTTGGNNTGVGVNALFTATTVSHNTALGATCMQSVTGAQNTAVGSAAMTSATSVSNSVAIGYQAMNGVCTGASNVAVGWTALKACTSGNNNSAIGAGALALCTSGVNNVAIGSGCLASLTSATGNTAVGASMSDCTTGDFNTAIGYHSLYRCTTGTTNCSLGTNSMFNFTTGSYNTAVGSGALQGVASVSTSDNNVAVGYHAHYGPGNDVIANALSTGTRNVALGTQTGFASATQRDDTIAIGHRALVDGNGAICLASGGLAGAAGAVAIGRDSGGTAASTTTADEIKLGTASHTLTVIGNASIGGAAKNLGFYGATAVAKQTGVAVTAAAIHAALVNLGLIAA